MSCEKKQTYEYIHIYICFCYKSYLNMQSDITIYILSVPKK